MVHFPGENGENGGRINISGGKVPQIRGKMVHFPGENGGKRKKTVKIPNK